MPPSGSMEQDVIRATGGAVAQGWHPSGVRSGAGQGTAPRRAPRSPQVRPGQGSGGASTSSWLGLSKSIDAYSRSFVSRW
ncbi:hypothetical protein GCM10023215_52240 [Pseudonocardia yuanmonensis]|uniref:Uncharacterized protein n=1 Tax=Pseudonocardia yuanmonensis TaxID=1095914 RepID=A0ABP8XE72_9PSEU